MANLRSPSATLRPCVCVCVCVCERDRQTDKERQGERERESLTISQTNPCFYVFAVQVF